MGIVFVYAQDSYGTDAEWSTLHKLGAYANKILYVASRALPPCRTRGFAVAQSA